MRDGSGDAVMELERVVQAFKEALSGIEIVDVLPEPTTRVWARVFDIGDDVVGEIDDVVLESTQRMAEHASRTIRDIKPSPTIVAVDVSSRQLATGSQYTFRVMAPVML